MQNAQRLEGKIKAPQGQNAQDYLVSQGQAQLNATRQTEVDRLAREMMNSGKANDMQSALTQAGQQYQSTLTPMQQIPLTPTQQVSMRYTGNATQGANTTFINPAQGQIPANLNPAALTAQQNQSIQNIGNNLKGTQQANFNNAFQAPNTNQLQNMNKTIANNQNQITQSQRAASQARGNNPAQQGNGFLSQYGMPLAVGTGLLGAGYLYANSGNQQQPNPSQGGV